MMRSPVIALLFFLLLNGCAEPKTSVDSLSGFINIFGVSIHSKADYRELVGHRAEEEPCLYGYERIFADLGVSIGYGFDKRIRKITTMNRQTSIFSIAPGSSLAEGRQKALAAGLIPDPSPNRFSYDGYSLTLLVEGDRITGMIIEESR
jgi:hypothetical protein